MIKADFEYLQSKIRSGQAKYKSATEVYWDDSITVEYQQEIIANGVLNYYIERDYFKSGQKRFEIHYTDGILDGPFIWWHENGKVWYKGRYMDNKQYDIWTYYYSNGTIQFEQEYDESGKRIR